MWAFAGCTKSPSGDPSLLEVVKTSVCWRKQSALMAVILGERWVTGNGPVWIRRCDAGGVSFSEWIMFYK